MRYDVVKLALWTAAAGPEEPDSDGRTIQLWFGLSADAINAEPVETRDVCSLKMFECEYVSGKERKSVDMSWFGS